MKKTTEALVSGTLDPLVRARINADKAWNAVKAAEKAWYAAAKKRTPEDSRPASDQWQHLDEYKAAWKDDHNADGKMENTRQHAVDAWNTRTANLPDAAPANSKPKTKQRQPVTQSKAAQLCNVTAKTVQRWEKGKGTPSRYPGRHDAVTLRAWAAWREQTR